MHIGAQMYHDPLQNMHCNFCQICGPSMVGNLSAIEITKEINYSTNCNFNKVIKLRPLYRKAEEEHITVFSRNDISNTFYVSRKISGPTQIMKKNCSQSLLFGSWQQGQLILSNILVSSSTKSQSLQVRSERVYYKCRKWRCQESLRII